VGNQPTKILGHLRSGEVVQDREQSHLHAGVERLLPEIFAQTDSRGRGNFIREFRFNRVVGYNNRVKTDSRDEIVYAQRVGRTGLSRFVKNRRPQKTNWVTVVFNCCANGVYEVLTAYLGTAALREPWDPRGNRRESIRFWSSEALLWGSEPVVEGTETTDVPDAFRAEGV
jgi:hypothetical protein